ncbi:MAG: hypothetical protein QM650_08105 [Microlunatus sp.]
MSHPGPWQQPRPPAPGPLPYGPFPNRRPPTPVPVVFGRIIAFLGIAAALACSVIWFFVGGMSLAAGPLCVECALGWLPPVAVGLIGPLVPAGIWVAALIAQWRKPLLLVWSLVGWPVLGAVNIWAIERFAVLFNQ